MTRTPWTLREALTILNVLTPTIQSRGYYPALSGSILRPPYTSTKDVDIVLFPYKMNGPMDYEGLVKDLEEKFSIRRTVRCSEIHKIWASQFAEPDTKHVEVFTTPLPYRRRIDLITVPSPGVR